MNDLCLITRFSVINFSLLLPVLGALTTTRNSLLPSGQIIILIVVAMAFHLFAYIHNDILDLPIDRTESLRRDAPLVRGDLSQNQAAIIVIFQIPIAIFATYLGQGTTLAYWVLFAAFCLAAIYNIFGKKCRFPFLTDALLSLSCCTFSLYGAVMSGGVLTVRTLILLGWFFLFAMMVNGIHGGLRDLENDFNSGARTTALYLNAKPILGGGMILSRAIIYYTYVIQGLLFGLGFLLLSYSVINHSVQVKLFAFITTFILDIVLALLLILASRSLNKRPDMVKYGILHIFISIGTLLLPFMFNLGAPSLMVVIVIYFLPIVVTWLFFGFRWD